MFARLVVTSSRGCRTQTLVREAHSFKNSEASKTSFWSKLLPSQKMRKNAEKKNLPAVAVLKLQGVIADQVID